MSFRPPQVCPVIETQPQNLACSIGSFKYSKRLQPQVSDGNEEGVQEGGGQKNVAQSTQGAGWLECCHRCNVQQTPCILLSNPLEEK